MHRARNFFGVLVEFQVEQDEMHFWLNFDKLITHSHFLHHSVTANTCVTRHIMNHLIKSCRKGRWNSAFILFYSCFHNVCFISCVRKSLQLFATAQMLQIPQLFL
jgi:hypothetical protein